MTLQEFKNSFYVKTLSGNLILINGLLFTFLCLQDGTLLSPSREALLFWGASDPVLLAQGEYWRLLSANFVHVGLLHFWFNAIGLKYVGVSIERLLGGKVFLLIYFLSGIFSVLASAYFNLTVSAGASGALFGLVGVGAVFESLYKNPSDRQQISPHLLLKEKIILWLRRRPFFALALINLFIAFLVNGLSAFFSFRVRVDNAAHVGGMLAGAILFYGLTFFLSSKRSTTFFLKAAGSLGFLIVFFFFLFQQIFITSYVKDAHVREGEKATELLLQYYHYTQALRLDPVDENLLFQRGATALIYGDLRGAIRDIHEALLLGYPREKFLEFSHQLSVLGKEKEATTLEMLLKTPQ